MEKRELTCIGCPMGCQLTAVMENGAVISVSGNTCKQGEAYARRECVAPMRTVTGTVRMADGRILPVRTRGEVPKAQVLAVAGAFAAIHPSAPVQIGDVVGKNICGTGVDVVAAAHAK